MAKTGLHPHILYIITYMGVSWQEEAMCIWVVRGTEEAGPCFSFLDGRHSSRTDQELYAPNTEHSAKDIQYTTITIISMQQLGVEEEKLDSDSWKMATEHEKTVL